MTEHNCVKDDKIRGLEREVGDLNKIVWRGNGQPSIVTQLGVLTDRINGLRWLVGTALAAIIVQIIVILFNRMGA